MAATLIAVIEAGFKVSRGLHQVISMWKEAPQELYIISAEIYSMAVMFDCVGDLVDDHQSLYKEDLTIMLTDLRCRFKIIQDVIAKCIKPSRRVRAFDRLRYLVYGRRIAGLVLKLQALKHSLSITISIAQMAQKHAKNAAAKRCQVLELRENVARELRVTQSITKQLLSTYQPTEPLGLTERGEDQLLVEHEDSPENMAHWMAITFSAPHVPVHRPALPWSASKELIQAPRAMLPFRVVPRPKPVGDDSRGARTFSADELDKGVLKSLGIRFAEEVNIRSSNGSVASRELTASAGP